MRNHFQWRCMTLLCVMAAMNIAAVAAAPTLTLNPPVLTQNGQLITVTWSDIPVGNASDPGNPTFADTIALVQSSDPFGTKYPIKYVWARQAAPSTYLAGSGSASFWVVNHRQNLNFLYLQYPSTSTGVGPDFAWGKQKVLATATLKVDPQLLKAPHQVRLSIKPRGWNPKRKAYPVQVAWQSTLPGGIAVAARSRAAAVWYQKYLAKPDIENRYKDQIQVATATADTYTPADLCGFPANSAGFLSPGYTNTAAWKPLTAQFKYYYFVGSATSGYSAIKSFTTPPLTDADCIDGNFNPNKPCFLGECNCLEKRVAPLKVLLAADVGTNNNLDNTWSADGQGFPEIDAAQSYNVSNSIKGFPGPLWPGRDYTPLVPLTLPLSNTFYLLYALADFPAWGQQPASYDVIKALNTRAATGDYHTAFIVGDIAYAEGMSAHWDMYLSNFEATMSAVPTMYSNGNHESSGKGLPDSANLYDPESAIPDGGGECGIVYEKRLKMPFADGVNPANRPEYYSYVMGPMAVVVLSTEQDWNVSSTQYNWLVSEFEKISAMRATGRVPWVVVALHRPMYVDDPDISVGIGNQWVASVLRSQLEPLFAKYQVDMTWTGHTHFYHRSCPVFKGGCRSPVASPDGSAINAPVHIMVGNGGFQPGAVVFNTTPQWIAKESFEYGYCTIEATQTSLNLQCFDAINGTKFDETQLTKSSGWRPNPAAAAQNYATLNTVLEPAGINVTAELLPAVEFIRKDLNAIQKVLNQSDLAYILSTWGAGSPIAGILNAAPGSKKYDMRQVAPMYYAVLKLLDMIFSRLPPNLVDPAAEELAYALQVNSPGGRLYTELNG